MALKTRPVRAKTIADPRLFCYLLLGGMILLTAANLTWLSLAQYRGYNLRSFDLGNMSQAIWSVTEERPLLFTTEGIVWSRLSLHVELIYFLIVPIYAFRSSPETLLIIQAVLYAAGAWPLFRFAAHRLNHVGAALGLVVVYLLYPVGQTAVLFHFHGDTLAVPLLLFAVNALDKKAWPAYGFWLILALACKFYVAVPVAIMGGIVWLQGERKAGLLTSLLAVGWGSVAFLVIRPLFASPEAAQTGASISYYFSHYFSQFFSLDAALLARLSNALIVFAPVLLLGVRAPLWLLPAASIVIPVMFSNGPGPSFDYRYHHYALAVPFLMVAAVYGLAHLRQKTATAELPGKWTNYVWLTLTLTLVFNALLVNTPLNPLFYLAQPGSQMGMDSSSYGRTPRDAFKDVWLADNVPASVPVAASDQLGFRLVNRPVLYRTEMKFKELVDVLPEVEFVVVDALHDFVTGGPDGVREGGVAVDHAVITELVARPDFKLLRMDDGLLLFGRQGEALALQAQLGTVQELGPNLATFGDLIALKDVVIEPLGNGRYQLSFTWQAIQTLVELPPFIAVSRPGDIPHSRFAHLPTLALQPTPTWQSGQLIYESFVVELPVTTPAGRYPLWTAWYDTTHYLAAETDANSRVGQEIQIGWLELP